MVLVVKKSGQKGEGIFNLSYDAAIVHGCQCLSWICNTSKKIGLTADLSGGYESWTLVSTREFGSANKVPQEKIPPEKEAEVKDLFLRAFESTVGVQHNSIKPIFCKLQLWGAAVPLNLYNSPAVYDADARVGICGDWLGSESDGISPSIESAYLSGLFMAEHIGQVAAGVELKNLKNIGLDKTSSCFLSSIGSTSLGKFSTKSQFSESDRGPLIINTIPSQAQKGNCDSVQQKKAWSKKI